MGFSYKTKLYGGSAVTSVSSGVIEANHTIRAIPAATVTITGATNATPIVVTAAAHGLVTGDNISISGITGNTNANGYFRITRLTADTFSLQNYSTGADIAGNGAYGGTPVAVTGIVQANEILGGDGTLATPTYGFASAPGYGMRLLSGTTLDFVVAAGRRLSVGAGSFSVFADAITLGNSGNQYLTVAAAATLQLGAAASATPVAQTLQSQGATGTDVAGANLTIRSGAGTGAATGSQLIFQTPAAGGSGSGAQTQTTRLTIGATGSTFAQSVGPSANDGYSIGFQGYQWTHAYLSRATLGSKTKTLTESSATGFVDIAVTAGQRISGEVIYEVYAADATDFQTITGRLRYAAVNKAGTTTVTVSEVGTQTTAVSTGTLTATNTAADTTNKITLSCNAVSSLTQTTLEIRYRIDSVSTNTITPL